MPKALSPERRQAVVFAACATILATFPSLALLPLRQAHWLSDPPYFMVTGLCIGLSTVCLAKAIIVLKRTKSLSSAER
jgi:hypothetical protein